MEPSFAVDGECRHLGLAVVTLGDGVALEQNLIVLAELHLHAIQHPTDGAHRYLLVPAVAGYGSRTLRQSVTGNHAYAHRVDKLLDGGRDGSSGRGEEVVVLESQLLQEQGDDGLLIEAILHLQCQGRREALHQIVHVVFLTHLDGILHQLALQCTAAVYLLLHAVIDLLPEAGYGALGEGQEVHHQFADVHRQCTLMGTHGCVVHAMRQHHTLAQARGAAGI